MTTIEAVGLASTVVAETARAEVIGRSTRDREAWPAVTARAVAPLADLVELGLPLLRPGGVLVAWKRFADGEPAAEAEVAAARRALGRIDADADLAIEPAIPVEATAPASPLSPLSPLADHRLVVVERGTRPVADEWPRDPAARRRRPW
jgi:hypothetical protein